MRITLERIGELIGGLRTADHREDWSASRQASDAIIGQFRSLLDEVERLRARLTVPCRGCPGCAVTPGGSSDCADARTRMEVAEAENERLRDLLPKAFGAGFHSISIDSRDDWLRKALKETGA